MRSSTGPAWAFAERAKFWQGQASELPLPYRVGEPGRLALLYAALALEAFIADELTIRLPPDISKELLESKKFTAARRWVAGAEKLAASGSLAHQALDRLRIACADCGSYGLLVRCRNKLVHPRSHAEFVDEHGHLVPETLSRLISALEKAAGPLPPVVPTFPLALESAVTADWAVQTTSEMVATFYACVGEVVPDQWSSL